MVRNIIIYGNYFIEFYKEQDQKAKDKIDFVLELIKYETRVPTKFLKHLTNAEGLYEVRVLTGNKQIRIFSFFDEGKLFILTNCFVKKTQKTPQKYLKQAIQLRKEYFKNKKL